MQKADGEYRLGLGVFEIGSLVAHHDRLVDLARPLMRGLSAQRFTTHLAVLDGDDVVYLEKLDGPAADALPSRVGGRLPAHCTGVGKTLLAHLSSELQEEYLSKKLTRRTASTLSDAHALRTELDRIRSNGFAMDHGEAVSGVACVAAPVFEHGRARAAISICVPKELMDPRQFCGPIRRAATSLSRRLSIS